MADTNVRNLERAASQGCERSAQALERERERMGVCPQCESKPPCPILEQALPGDEDVRACASSLPDCEDCEGDGESIYTDDDGEQETCKRCEGSGKDPYGIVIDGESYILETIRSLGFQAEMVEISPSVGHSPSFIVSEDQETAGQAARERWAEMAEHDPSEFACIVGEQTLVAWALGQPAGPGTSQVTSLSEWLDLWLDTPEEEWAGWDHAEREPSEVGPALRDELGFWPGVAYRSN